MKWACKLAGGQYRVGPFTTEGTDDWESAKVIIAHRLNLSVDDVTEGMEWGEYERKAIEATVHAIDHLGGGISVSVGENSSNGD